MKIEESPTPGVDGILEIDGYDDLIVNHHIALLKDAGFINAIEMQDANTPYGYLMQDASLVWSGHEFLDSIRDQEVWDKTKQGVKSVGSWTVSLVGELAKGYLKQKAIDIGLKRPGFSGGGFI